MTRVCHFLQPGDICRLHHPTGSFLVYHGPVAICLTAFRLGSVTKYAGVALKWSFSASGPEFYMEPSNLCRVLKWYYYKRIVLQHDSATIQKYYNNCPTAGNSTKHCEQYCIYINSTTNLPNSVNTTSHHNNGSGGSVIFTSRLANLAGCRSTEENPIGTKLQQRGIHSKFLRGILVQYLRQQNSQKFFKKVRPLKHCNLWDFHGYSPYLVKDYIIF